MLLEPTRCHVMAAIVSMWLPNCHTCNAVAAGKLHVLVNNVGTNKRRPTLEYTPEDANAMLSANLTSAFHLTQRCHSMLQKAGDACVINMSSVSGGPLAMKSGCVYAMTKGTTRPCQNAMHAGSCRA